MAYLIEQSVRFLIFLSETLGSLGWAIIAFTLLTKFAIFPLATSSIKAQKQLQKLQPELKKLNEKYKNDKQKLQQAQMELYQKYNANPIAGCVPQLLQLGVIIILYQAMLAFLGEDIPQGMNLNFFWFNLTQADKTYVLPILSGLTQLILSLMIAPGGEVRDLVPNKSKNQKVKVANEKEENMAEMAATMQQQMIFVMPVIMVVITAQFPSGLALYWVVSNIFTIGQQYFISGWGGLIVYYQRLVNKYGKN
ncbi:MAG: membrane protein insertase YidC [Candidatus Pacebacteria bacterium]|nr:membrane protein insertase YidC [Candidatus Paceibacterota bacterium]